MYAAQKYGAAEAFRFDRYTVTMTHPDALIALTSGSGQIDAHFTSPPFHQREIGDPKVHTVLSSDDIMGGSTTFTMLSIFVAFLLFGLLMTIRGAFTFGVVLSAAYGILQTAVRTATGIEIVLRGDVIKRTWNLPVGQGTATNRHAQPRACSR